MDVTSIMKTKFSRPDRNSTGMGTETNKLDPTAALHSYATGIKKFSTSADERSEQQQTAEKHSTHCSPTAGNYSATKAALATTERKLFESDHSCRRY